MSRYGGRKWDKRQLQSGGGASFRGRGRAAADSWDGKAPDKDAAFKSDRQKAKEKEERDAQDAELDSKFGFDPYLSTEPRTAFLFNIRASSLADAAASSSSSASSYACLDCYFVCDDGSTFKASVPHLPYFYLLLRHCSPSDYLEAETYLLRRYEGLLHSCSLHDMEDLSLPNHLSGLKRGYVRLSFRNVSDMLSVRNRLITVVADNKKKEDSKGGAAAAVFSSSSSPSTLDGHQLRQRRRRDAILDSFIDIREYDVPYVTRVAIDLRIRVGGWYDVALIPAAAAADAASASPASSSSSSSAASFLPSSQSSFICHSLRARAELLTPPHLKKCTFDIETTKSPLKFPNAEVDNIMMLSLMMDDQGFLLVNRDIVSADIADFEYSPSEEMQGHFSCINVAGERELLLEFFALVRQHRPLLFISYNGDFFDWPFIAARCSAHGLSLLQEAGVYQRDDEFVGKSALHLDCFCWVKRDSYLPQGSQGLKAVTRAKLQYCPVEVDPEQMLTLAAEQPQQLAAYSVSDAVATHFLYLKFIHLFVFSLSTIIPMSASDVLRKGSGTLCESLLQVQAAAAGIIAPNKQEDELSRFHRGHLIDSESYSGGHVECIESGVFRSDIPVRFKLEHERLMRLRQGVRDTLRFAVEKEHSRKLEELLNREEVERRIESMLDGLLQSPSVDCLPLIYHLDVGAMYPNIILTNRLQPMAVVDDSVCAACDFNVSGSDCQRRMEWKWRGRFFPATRGEVDSIRRSLEYEANIAAAAPAAAAPASSSSSSSSSARSAYKKTGAAAPAAAAAAASASYNDLPASAQSAALKAKVKAYSHRVYSKYTVESTESRVAIVCQRENSFYVDTVRAFRDRRYEYKLMGKQAKREADAAAARGDRLERERAVARLLVFDSLQLAHKCILNSFYGYVMRRGARWQSIEMAGVVTNTGAQLIREARELVEDIGRPLELDTDGIWCMLPASFPDSFELRWEGGGSSRWSYPCSLLNEAVAERYTNTQYQELKRSETEDGQVSAHYEQRSECSILFEVDGPYRAMVLPAAREEGRNIKKRYAVFAHDGSISELKGFELKRRGELKLIKVFQSALFDKFLLGSTLSECYAAVAAVCNQWLDVLLSRGEGMEEDDIIELISESRSMADTLDEYGSRRSTSISTARRLGQFLGPEMLTDRGLNCKFVIAAKPEGASTSDRAIPTAIFAADDAVKRRFLRAWLRDATMEDFDIRSLIDWSYYVSRLSAAIQKIVTIPAAMQRVPNPVERVRHPDWLGRRVRERDDSQRQMRIGRFFHKKGNGDAVMDIEDVGGQDGGRGRQQQRQQAAVLKRKKTMGGGGVRVGVEEPEGEEDADAVLAEGEEEKQEPQEDDEVMIVEQLVGEPETQREGTEQAAAAAAEGGDSFSVWLTSRKQEWKAMKERKRRLRHVVASSAPSAAFASASSSARAASLPSLTGGLHSYLQQSTASLLSSAWQIIQITPELTTASSPPSGLYRFWIFLHPATLTSVSVRADRLFLLNSRVKLSGDDAHRKVERTLPRGRKAGFLYEMRVDEREWREKEAAYLDALGEESVEGMYETQVSPLFRLLRDVGCVCRPTVGRAMTGSEFDAAQLQYKTSTECGYLSSPALYRGFLYSSQRGGAAQRAVFCLCFEHSVDVLLIIVNGYGGDTEPVNAGRLFRQAYAEMKRKGGDEAEGRTQAGDGRGQETAEEADVDDAELPRHSFTVRHSASMSDAYALLREALQRHKQLSSHATVLLCQVPTPLPLLYLQLPSLRSDFPVVCIPHHSRDNAYPTFHWTSHALSVALLRYLQCSDWYEAHLALCRWAHLPIGNLDADVPVQLMDVMYARALQAGKHAMWSSRAGGAEVELGGRWLEEERLMAEEEGESGPLRLEVNHSGCYRSTCYELSMQGLCVNAVLQSAFIEEESGTADRSSEEDDGSGSSSAPVSIARAFAILKQTVHALYSDITRHHNLHADLLLQHFHRWLQSPLSCLSEPLLQAAVQSLMHRLYHSLLSRLTLLGSTIVHASLHRIILCTKKRDAQQAAQYVAFILSTLSKRPMYALLTFAVSRQWSALLWLDDYNHGGVLVHDDDRERLCALSAGEHEPEVADSWQMAEYLPLHCRQWLLILVRRYVLQPHLHHLQHKHAALEEKDDCCRAELLSLLRHIESQLYSLLPTLNKTPAASASVSASSSSSPVAFPLVAGQHLLMTNPALEFTKQVCQLLSLEPSTRDEVRRLRENLLRLLSVNAWSPQAAFVNPCMPVVVRDLVCAFCNVMKDVDLCRNNHAAAVQGEEQDADGSEQQQDGGEADGDGGGARKQHSLYCEHCHHKYEARVVEERLMRRVRQRLLRYSLQDLLCCACGSMADRHLQLRCDCSGEYRGAREDGGSEERQREWRVLAGVCQQYGYQQAGDMVALLLSINSTGEDGDSRRIRG